MYYGTSQIFVQN